MLLILHQLAIFLSISLCFMLNSIGRFFCFVFWITTIQAVNDSITLKWTCSCRMNKKDWKQTWASQKLNKRNNLKGAVRRIKCRKELNAFYSASVRFKQNTDFYQSIAFKNTERISQLQLEIWLKLAHLK